MHKPKRRKCGGDNRCFSCDGYGVKATQVPDADGVAMDFYVKCKHCPNASGKAWENDVQPDLTGLEKYL